METTDAGIGHRSEKDGRSPQGGLRTCLTPDAAITLHWAVGRRCAADAGDDSEVTWASMLSADVGTLVPFHIYDEVHQFIECGPSGNEVKTIKEIGTTNSQPNVIEPKPTIIPPLPTTGASPLEMSWQMTGSWPPWCASTPRDSRFSMEGRDLESICKAAVRRIDECLEEAAELVKSIQLSRNGRRESTTQGL